MYAALKLPKKELDGVLRISFSYDTAREDVDAGPGAEGGSGPAVHQFVLRGASDTEENK